MVTWLLSWQILCGNFILPSGCAHVRYFSERFSILRNLLYLIVMVCVLTIVGKPHFTTAIRKFPYPVGAAADEAGIDGSDPD